MIIRPYKSTDIDEIAELFYNSVHRAANKDYNPEQLCAWADGNLDKSKWNSSFLEHYTLIAEENGTIIAFADLDGNYLDRLYTHAEWQGKGAASALCKALEEQALLNKADYIETHASITARPFFENRGYKVINEQIVQRNGQSLKNYVMRKSLSKILV